MDNNPANINKTNNCIHENNYGIRSCCAIKVQKLNKKQTKTPILIVN